MIFKKYFKIPFKKTIFRIRKYEYGENDKFLIKLFYRRLNYDIKYYFKEETQNFMLNNFRNEYLICELSCLISSFGGYVGLFFGISFFDLLYFMEWIIKIIHDKTKLMTK